MTDAGLFILIVTLDRVTKALVPHLLELHHSLPVIPSFFSLTYVRNSGVAFGLLSGWDSPLRRVFLILASLGAMVLLGALYRQARRVGGTRALRLSLVSIGAGAAGNLYDRSLHGEVVDFLDFFLGSWHWPAFNVADTAITLGALTMAWLYATGRLESQLGQGEE